MKKLFLLSVLLILSATAINAQTTSPRSFIIRLVEADRSSVSDTTGLSFTANLHGRTRTHTHFNFGIFSGDGNVYSKVQLGNFGIEWVSGDTLIFQARRATPLAITEPAELVITEGAGPVWWGAPKKYGQDFPGSPLRLCPVLLTVKATTETAQPVLKDGIKTEMLTGQTLIAETESDISGEFSLAPPPTGWRWEPARHFVSLRDFEFSDSAYADADGVAQPGWARTLEFRLVPEE